MDGPPLGARIGWALLLFAFGAAFAVAGVATHRLWWGLTLGLLSLLLVVRALPPGWWCRLAWGMGHAVMCAWLMVPRAEGDYLIASDLSGYLLLATAVLAPAVGILTLPRARRVPPEGEPAAP